MRPVVLSVARECAPPEADRAFRLILRLSVRFIIAGGARSAARSGAVEEALAEAARKISERKITTAAGVLAELDTVVPKDPQFQEAFATASVSNAALGRYYMRSLESAVKGERHPLYVAIEDAQVVNLEHVLPRKPERNWPQFSREEAEAFHRRIDNFALLRAKANSDLKSLPFAEKKAVYAEADSYEFTSQLASADDWTPAAITARQRKMAEYAVKTWPLSAE